MDLKQELGKRIREAREHLRMNQQKLADAAGFPSLQTVSDIERGIRDVRAWELLRIARVLHLSIVDLLADQVPQAPVVLWRKEPSEAPAREAAFIEHCRNYRFLEEITGRKVTTQLPKERVEPEKFDFRQAA